MFVSFAMESLMRGAGGRLKGLRLRKYEVGPGPGSGHTAFTEVATDALVCPAVRMSRAATWTRSKVVAVESAKRSPGLTPGRRGCSLSREHFADASDLGAYAF